MYKKIYVDQCGYLPDMKKTVTFQSDSPVTFQVLTSSGQCVYSGEANEKIENKAAGESDYLGDFSSVATPGRYYITCKELGESDTFEIADNVYSDVFQKSMAFFYLQRCGQELPKMAAGKYAHPACHTGLGRVYGSTEQMEVSGGWHDAGDFGRYVGPGAMSVAQLLYAYERNPKLCDSYVSPELLSGKMPDFLDELTYEINWMMKMQRADGALYHKATCCKFCDFIMPDQEKEEMVLSPVSVTATGDFAAVCAMAIRFYEKYDADYAEKLAVAAKKAYAAMKKMDIPGGFKNPEDISTGEYGDESDLDERYWAAAELYKAFGDKEYAEDFEALAKEKIYHGYGWSDMGTYGNLAYITTTYPVNEELKKKIKVSMLEQADRLLTLSNADGYSTSLSEKEYIWGSNLSVTNNGLMLFDAWQITGDKKYLDAAMEQIHYILGRNPMGLCYVTGCGTDAIKHPHHRPSGFVGAAMPGMVSGGPCSWFADDTIKGLFTQENAPAPAKCLVDMTGSYSTNEVTIYWNSSFVQLLSSILV